MKFIHQTKSALVKIEGPRRRKTIYPLSRELDFVKKVPVDLMSTDQPNKEFVSDVMRTTREIFPSQQSQARGLDSPQIARFEMSVV